MSSTFTEEALTGKYCVFSCNFDEILMKMGPEVYNKNSICMSSAEIKTSNFLSTTEFLTKQNIVMNNLETHMHI